MNRTFTHKWRAVLCLLAMLMLVPMMAQAEAETKTIYYKQADGSVDSCEATQITSDMRTITGNYYASGILYIRGPLKVSGSARLILLDGAELVPLGCVVVEGVDSLTITSGNTTRNIADTGKLRVSDYYNGDGSGDNKNDGDDARIGSREGNSCGYIIINGGNITTFSSYTGTYAIYGADIGSGYKGNSGCIIINGGNVYCKGGHYYIDEKINENENGMSGAAIGSGKNATDDGPVWIRINGGYVEAVPTANETSWGAAIGTGEDAKGRADIVINDGTVVAIASTNGVGRGAGIGAGDTYKAEDNISVVINGGTVTAYSSRCDNEVTGYGAGIGMCDIWNESNGKVDVTITGGTVHAQSGVYYSRGAGIGGGRSGGTGNIVISGTANVKAYACDPQYNNFGSEKIRLIFIMIVLLASAIAAILMAR